MAITRSQIARQLLAAGGVSFESPGNTTLQRVLPRMDGQRPGFYGPDMGEGGKESDFGQDTYSTSDVDFGGEPGGTRQEFRDTAEAIGTPKTPSGLDNFRANQLKKQLDIMYGNTSLFGSMNLFRGPAVDVYNKDFLGSGQKPEDVVGLDQYGMKGSDLTRSQNIQNALDTFQQTGSLSQSQFEKAFGAKGPTKTPSGENTVPIIPLVPKLPTDIEPEKSDYNEFVQRFTLPEAYRLADGGEVRQAYGLGSIVKKVTGAVKKVAKSDIGKAALIAGTGYYLGGGSMGPFAKFLPTMKYGNAAGTGFGFGNILPNVLSSFGATGLADKAFTMGTAGKIATGIGAATLAAGLLTPKQEEEADSLSKRISDRTGLDIAGIRKEVQDAYANNNVGSLKNKYPFLITESAAAADGGRIGYDMGGLSEGTSMEQKEFEKFLDDMKQRDMGAMRDQILKDFEKYKQRKKMIDKMPEVKDGGRIGYDMGGISGMMASNMENDKILENLFEKYLDMGLSPENAAKKAREEFDKMSKKQGIERTMAAGGGMMNPNDEMLNLGGNEMDLRGGGFVPLGEYEKKDDVPARLSKNEFVFTADAVKAAGGGSVDRGADLMYKTMKQLENKVA